LIWSQPAAGEVAVGRGVSSQLDQTSAVQGRRCASSAAGSPWSGPRLAALACGGRQQANHQLSNKPARCSLAQAHPGFARIVYLSQLRPVRWTPSTSIAERRDAENRREQRASAGFSGGLRVEFCEAQIPGGV